MAQSASLWRLFGQSGSHFQQSSIGFPVKQADSSFWDIWRVFLLEIEAFTLLQNTMNEQEFEVCAAKKVTGGSHGKKVNNIIQKGKLRGAIAVLSSSSGSH